MKKDLHKAASEELRHRAEEVLAKQPVPAPRSVEETQSLLHELRVHQVELEMQNEELRAARAEIEADLERYAELYDMAPVGYFTLRRDSTIQQTNLTGASLLGAMRSQINNRRFGSFVREESLPAFNDFLNQVFASNTKVSCEVALRGTDQPVWVNIEAVADGSGQTCRLALLDITERRQAKLDPLTGLINRRMFHDCLEHAIRKAHRDGLPVALMLIDLDRFKEVNDNLGHDKGDILLIETARRIAECVRESDTVARMGGDEFTVILPELEDVSIVERIAQNIIARLAMLFKLGTDSAYVSASIGITLYPSDAKEAETLLKNADQAMYAAKNAGRNCFSYFTTALQVAAQNRMHLSHELRGALSANQLMVYYQPIVELATGSIHKAEALIRWQHPERGMINPVQFIPLAEKSGLINEIDDWVFKKTANQVKHWRMNHDPAFQISVNKSPVQSRREEDRSEATWLNYLHDIELPGESIVIDMAEQTLLNSRQNITGKEFKSRFDGIQIAIDEFGTDYASLAYLKKLDIGYIKIDLPFVRNLENDPDNLALCEAIIAMAQKLGLKVIAQGVENSAQRDLLARAGCDYAQGYLFSKPVPAEEFEALF